MEQHIGTVIVGGGQAGLALSYCLRQLGREHVVLEQAAAPASAWREERWDSFTLLTPNWTVKLPGAEYAGDAPDAFMARAGIIALLEQYARRHRMPVRYNTRVTSIAQAASGTGYRVETSGGVWSADNVVVATGLYQRPRVPAYAAALPADFPQMHSGRYRNPGSLPPGAVLVVGSAQSGCQIAEELHQAGRMVYLSVGKAGRAPRRYRGRDTFEWLDLAGFLDRTAAQLPSSQARFAPNPHVSGKDGGHTINLHQFARDGVILLGHLRGVDGYDIALAPDLAEGLAAADKVESDMTRMIDAYIARQGLDAPPEELPRLRDGYDAPGVTGLSLRKAGIGTVIWATGYAFDFSMVHLPVLDGDGFPIQTGMLGAGSDGSLPATRFPGLYFLGLPFLARAKSGLFLGVAGDAERIAEAIAARAR